MTITIRRGTVEDAVPLSQVAGALFRQTYEDELPADQLELYLSEDFNESRQRDELLDPDVVTLLVERDGELVGFAQLRRRPLPSEMQAPADCELWRIYLDRSCHGSGIGRSLLDEVGSVARSVAERGVWLAVWERNARAIAFYEKHGFEVVGRQPFHVGAVVHEDLVMRASLEAL